MSASQALSPAASFTNPATTHQLRKTGPTGQRWPARTARRCRCERPVRRVRDPRHDRPAGARRPLAGDPALSSKDYMAEVLLLGRRNMPAFGTRHAVASFYEPITLNYEQIAAVVNYVRTHFGNHYKDSMTAAQVEALDAKR